MSIPCRKKIHEKHAEWWWTCSHDFSQKRNFFSTLVRRRRNARNNFPMTLQKNKLWNYATIPKYTLYFFVFPSLHYNVNEQYLQRRAFNTSWRSFFFRSSMLFTPQDAIWKYFFTRLLTLHIFFVWYSFYYWITFCSNNNYMVVGWLIV